MDPSQIKTFEDIVQFAIQKEQDAADLYAGLASKAKSGAAKAMFEELQKQEEGHKKKLENRGCEGLPAKGQAEIPDLKMGDYLVDVAITPDSSYQDILIFAIKNEMAAIALYTNLKAQAGETGGTELFDSLADEERMHKLRLEKEYDEYVLKWN